MELNILSAPAARTPDRAPARKLEEQRLPLDEQIDPGRHTVALARKTLKQYGCNALLTESNPKTDKSTKYGYLTGPLHLAPSTLSGHNMCPCCSQGCSAACLHTAGARHYLPAKTTARIARTLFWVEQPDLFKALLVWEIDRHIRAAKDAGLIPTVRLNTTSDVVWEQTFPALFMRFNTLRLYDYSKVVRRFERPLPPNYSLTFSRSEDNDRDTMRILSRGGNVAVVFGGCGITTFPKPLPETWRGYPVVDGDLHDLRFLDPRGVVVGLRAKGQARHDHSGFVVWPRQA